MQDTCVTTAPAPSPRVTSSRRPSSCLPVHGVLPHCLQVVEMRPAQRCAALALAARPCDGLGLFGAEKNKLKPEMALPVLARHRNTEIATKTDETWMRNKERLKGE